MIWSLLLICAAVATAQYPVFLNPVQPAIPPGHQSYYPVVPPAPQVNYPQVPAAAARCVLVPASNSQVSGEIELYQSSGSNMVQVRGSIQGLSPGLHGFHLHQEGSTANDCKAAGPHFNPLNYTHGGPGDQVRHAGDFGNIQALANGHADFQLEDSHISLDPSNIGYAVGHAIVVHAGQDDLGRGNNEESLKTGNAGGRLACCVVEAISYK